MADSPFDLVVFNQTEKPFSSDMNQLESQLLRSLMDTLLWSTQRRSSDASEAGIVLGGFLGDSLRVYPGVGMSVLILQGIGALADAAQYTDIGSPNILGLDDLSAYKPLVMSLPVTRAIDASPGGGQERWDLIECTPRRALTDTASRDIWNGLAPPAGAFAPSNVSKTLSYDYAMIGPPAVARVVSPAPSTAPISYKVGTPAVIGTAVRPAVTVGYSALGYIYTTGVGASVLANQVQDARQLLLQGGVGALGCRISCPSAHPAVGSLTLSNIVTPPGVALVGSYVSSTVSAGAVVVRFDLYVLGGAGFSAVAPMISALSYGSFLPNMLVVNVALIESRPANSGDVAALNAGSPSYQACLGQPITIVHVVFTGINGTASPVTPQSPQDDLATLLFHAVVRP